MGRHPRSTLPIKCYTTCSGTTTHLTIAKFCPIQFLIPAEKGIYVKNSLKREKLLELKMNIGR
jgi:hypothetical protein